MDQFPIPRQDTPAASVWQILLKIKAFKIKIENTFQKYLL